MRLWSIDPDLLDRRALVAGWRETLLAQKVLAGGTKGYTRHPQLERFREQPEPLLSIAAYLHGLADAADRRGYNFDRSRILQDVDVRAPQIPVTTGQRDYEWQHLRAKVAVRDKPWHETVLAGKAPALHPLFYEVEGPIASWEVV